MYDLKIFSFMLQVISILLIVSFAVKKLFRFIQLHLLLVLSMSIQKITVKTNARSFTVSSLKFKFLIHVGLSFMDVVCQGSNFIFCMSFFSFPCIIHQRDLLLIEYLWLSCQILVNHIFKGLFLFYWSMCLFLHQDHTKSTSVMMVCIKWLSGYLLLHILV